MSLVLITLKFFGSATYGDNVFQLFSSFRIEQKLNGKFFVHLQAANHFSNDRCDGISHTHAVVIVTVQLINTIGISVNFVDIKNAFEWE